VVRIGDGLLHDALQQAEPSLKIVSVALLLLSLHI